jgi:predicted aldo/keto reductase-like oxidoreductase
MEQVEQNVASATLSAPHTMTDAELAVVDRAREAYQGFRAIPCTQCRYCMPCSNGVDIPLNLYMYNFGKMYDKVGMSRMFYHEALDEAARASACIQCRECEDRCTQQILISEWMPQVHAVLGRKQPYPA